MPRSAISHKGRKTSKNGPEQPTTLTILNHCGENRDEPPCVAADSLPSAQFADAWVEVHAKETHRQDFVGSRRKCHFPVTVTDHQRRNVPLSCPCKRAESLLTGRAVHTGSGSDGTAGHLKEIPLPDPIVVLKESLLNAGIRLEVIAPLWNDEDLVGPEISDTAA